MEDNVFGLFNGTNISRIRKQKLQRNNTTGVRGVHKVLGPTPQDDRWIAMIGVQRKRIYLGCFHSLDDAVKERYLFHIKDDGLLIKPSRYCGSFAAWFGGFAHGQKNTD